MRKQNDSTGTRDVVLSTKSVSVSELELFVRRNVITSASFVAFGLAPNGDTHLNWIDGFPSKLEEKLDLPVHHLPEYRYFESIQRLAGSFLPIAECEPEVHRNPYFVEAVQILERTLFDRDAGRGRRPCQDIHLVLPDGHDAIIETVKVAQGEAVALWSGKGAEFLAHPRRLPAGGFLASRGKDIVHYPSIPPGPTSVHGVFGRIVAVLDAPIEYLSRVNPGKLEVIATTRDPVTHQRTYVALDVRSLTPDALSPAAKVVLTRPAMARALGTPAGNGVPIFGEKAEKGGRNTLRLWPISASPIADIAQTAC